MVLSFGLIESDLFPNSNAAGEGIAAPIVNQIIWKDVGIGIVPIGSIVSWVPELFDTKPPLLPNFVECNGQTLSDGDRPLNGKTIPNLNGGNRFLRGNSTSGGTGSNETHTHTMPTTGFDAFSGANAIRVSNAISGGGDSKPPYYEIVWIMRIK